MRRIDSMEDDMNRCVTYELDDGRRVRVDVDVVRLYGLAHVMRELGVAVSDQRVPVYQSGEKIGSVPSGFDTQFIKSQSFLYDPRPGDFKREGDRWIADKMLGPGDLDAIPGFVWDRSE
jgi:hypothetical protein